MIKKTSTIIALLAGTLFAANSFAAEKLTVVGTGDGVAVLKAIGKAFQEKADLEVDVPKSIGSGGGIKAVGGDKTPLGRVARAIKESEKEFGLTYKPIFYVPTVFFVHNSVDVTNLSAGQVADIFQGKITNWKDVGGADKAINLVRREDDDSSLKNLRKSFPGFKDLVFPESIRMAKKTPVMIKTILNVEDSIGFGPRDVAIENNLKVLNIDGKDPSDESYPTRGIIALIYKEKNFSGDLKKFVEFAASKDVHDAIKKAGGIPIGK